MPTLEWIGKEKVILLNLEMFSILGNGNTINKSIAENKVKILPYKKAKVLNLRK